MIKAIIIDDERLARNELKKLLMEFPEIEVVAEAANAGEGIEKIENINPDLVFLDIQMPRMSGLELVRSLPERPAVIFTTAYREYGVDGFELDALDYLVKPITFDRFLKAIAKFNQQVVMKKGFDQTHENNAFDKAYMYFKVNRDLVKIFLKNIIYIESIRDYIKVITENQSIISKRIISLSSNYKMVQQFNIHEGRSILEFFCELNIS